MAPTGHDESRATGETIEQHRDERVSWRGLKRTGLLSGAVFTGAFVSAGSHEAGSTEFPAVFPEPLAVVTQAGPEDTARPSEVATATMSTPISRPADTAVPAPSADIVRKDSPLDTPSVTSAVIAEERPRSRWRRSRNRYPGPIPTPEEWEPPEGPVKIALQAGHWRASEAPPELYGIRTNGTRWEETLEWQTNLSIAERAAALLESLGYAVEVLPAIVPPGYRAHLFISIHADGSADPRASGYRVAAPRQDATGRAAAAAALLDASYGAATGIKRLPTVTRRMQSYYAFNFRRYEHALHPMTIGVILETGFLTNEGDRQVIMGDPDRAARGIVEAVTKFEITPPPRLADGSQPR